MHEANRVTVVESIRVLTWNLFHCRDGRPAATAGSTWRRESVERDGYVHLNRKYCDEMATVIRAAGADLVMLQEVPPRAIERLRQRSGATAVWSVRTSPRLGPPGLRGWLGERNPDLWKTHEGNANVILAGPRLAAETGSARGIRLNPPGLILRAARRYRLPAAEVAHWALEARMALTVRLAVPGGSPFTAVCVHHHGARNPRQLDDEMGLLGRALDAIPGALILGGDINAGPEHPGFAAWRASGLHDGTTDPGIGIDRILVRGLELVESPRRLATSVRERPLATPAGPRRVLLSDHDPVQATVRAPG